MLPNVLFVTLVCISTLVAALPDITRKGKYLYDPSGNRFYIRGIAYQEPGEYSTNSTSADANGGFPEPSSYTDPLDQSSNCDRDVPLLQQLGVNTIRAYSVNPYGDHSHCMNLLEAANIYTIIDLTLPLNGSIDRSAPAWTTSLLDQFIVTIDNFRQYNNVLAFNVGNEVVAAANQTFTAPYIKAAARDVKAYLRSVNSNILVGYASTDGDTWMPELATYLACASDDTSIDLFGLNNYRWCGTSTYDATFASINVAFNDFPVAAYFSEFGCITATRTWTEINALLAAPMTDNWSGGVAFQYFENTGDPGYGMVTGDVNAATVTPNTDFNTLRTVLGSVPAPPNTPTQGAAADSSYPTCPTNLNASSVLPPTPNHKLCDCAQTNAFTCTIRDGASPAVIGTLIDYSCSLLGQTTGQSDGCDAISSDGSTGVYGNFSSCTPAQKLDYVMSQYTVSQNWNADACNFGGNATINRNAPSQSSAVDNALNKCLTGGNASATFVPGSSTFGAGHGSGGAAISISPFIAPMLASGLATAFGALLIWRL